MFFVIKSFSYDCFLSIPINTNEKSSNVVIYL